MADRDAGAEGQIEVDEHSGQPTTGHVWDGIRELNTPLPRWWLWTFYATIAFAVVYMVLYPADSAHSFRDRRRARLFDPRQGRGLAYRREGGPGRKPGTRGHHVA